MSRWFRVYDNMLDDPKVQRLSPELFKILINLWCLASQHDGWLPPIEDVAFRLRLEPSVASAYIEQLCVAGLIDEIGKSNALRNAFRNGNDFEILMRPHNWDGRQFKRDGDPTNSERQKRYRENQRLKKSNALRNTVTAVTVTRLDTDTESESKKDSCAVAEATRTDRQPFKNKFEEFWKAYPKREGSNPKHPAEKKFHAAAKSGENPDAIIDGARRYGIECRDRKLIGTPMVAQAQTWLNQRRWQDYAQAELPQSRAPPPPTAEQLAARQQLIDEGQAYINGNGRDHEDYQQDTQSEGTGMVPIRVQPRTFDG